MVTPKYRISKEKATRPGWHGDQDEVMVADASTHVVPKLGQMGIVYGEVYVVRYIGSHSRPKAAALLGWRAVPDDLPGAELVVLGVECTRKGRGVHDGAVNGTSYFHCPAGCGRFVLPESYEEYDAILLSVIRIQRSWRGLLGRRTERRAAAVRSWDILETIEENATLENLRRVGCEVEAIVQQEMGTTDKGAEFPSPRIPTGIADDDPIPEGYQGPNFAGELGDVAFADALFDHYRSNPDDKLPRRFVWKLLCAVERRLEENVRSAVYCFSIPSRIDTRMIVVGDTHGQLKDVMWVFFKFGVPSPSNIYLFNGDIADRGKNAVEIFLLLFAFMLGYPDATTVIINRGNHEDEEMNNVYGFTDEVRLKYGGTVFQKFQQIFKLLPLCVVVNQAVLVVHGGLFRQPGVTLADIDAVDRRRSCPTNPRTKEDELMFDLLWSDPQPAAGRGLNRRGADCILFGPDVTDEFLANNDLEVVLRSHQVPHTLRGFESLHDGRVVTLFSASDYCGTMGNLGGVIIFEPEMTFEIVEFLAPGLDRIQSLNLETQQATQKVISGLSRSQMIKAEHSVISNRRSSIFSVERDAIKKIQRLFCDRKQALANRFREIDVSRIGLVTVGEWRDVCSTIVCETLPWLYVRKRLRVEIRSDGLVPYERFLSRFRVEFRPKDVRHENWRNVAIRQIFESIMLADLSIKETVIVVDRNADGEVSYRDFSDLLTELKLDLSGPQMRLLLRLISPLQPSSPKKEDPDPIEFLGRFKLLYTNSLRQPSPSQSTTWMSAALEEIGRRLVQNKAEWAERHYGPQSDTGRRRSSALRSVALFQQFKEWSEEVVDDSIKMLQLEIQYDIEEEIQQESNVNSKSDLQNEKLKMIKYFESDHLCLDGFLSYEGFIKAMRKLQVDDRTCPQLRKGLNLWRLARALDVTNSGRINFVEFLHAFHMAKDNSSADVVAELWGEVCLALFQNQSAIRRAMRRLDPNLSGLAKVEEFRNVLLILNQIIRKASPTDGAPLTVEQINLLASCVGVDDEGMVDYEDFLASFIVVDTEYDRLQGSASSLEEDEESRAQFLDADIPSLPSSLDSMRFCAELSSSSIGGCGGGIKQRRIRWPQQPQNFE